MTTTPYKKSGKDPKIEVSRQEPPQDSSLSKKTQSFQIRFSGTWRSLYLLGKEDELNNIVQSFKAPLSTQLIFEEGFIADTAGALLIAQFIDKISKMGGIIQGEISPFVQPYLNKDILLTKPPRIGFWYNLLETLGKHVIFALRTIYILLAFFGEVVVNFLKHLSYYRHKIEQRFRKPFTPMGPSEDPPVRWVSIVHHLDVVGFQAIPIISLISLLIGAVLAYQGVNQLNRFGAPIYTVDFLAISLLREISVLLTSIVIAGRSGSAFTAQIGTMMLNQEVDAIRMLGLNPIQVLVIPRIIALFIALPLLVLLSMALGAIGGMVITRLTIDLHFVQFIDLFQKAVSNTTFFVGMSKAPLFALVISIVGCYRGFQVKQSAESVGAMTTQSVVESIFLVIVLDGLVSILYSYLDI